MPPNSTSPNFFSMPAPIILSASATTRRTCGGAGRGRDVLGARAKRGETGRAQWRRSGARRPRWGVAAAVAAGWRARGSAGDSGEGGLGAQRPRADLAGADGGGVGRGGGSRRTDGRKGAGGAGCGGAARVAEEAEVAGSATAQTWRGTGTGGKGIRTARKAVRRGTPIPRRARPLRVARPGARPPSPAAPGHGGVPGLVCEVSARETTQLRAICPS